MNIELLRQVQEKIREEGRVYMESWFVNGSVYYDQDYCGTIGCIAGWAAICHFGEQNAVAGLRDIAYSKPGFRATDSPEQQGGEHLLDLTPEEAQRLFYLPNWPEEFQRRYQAAARAAAGKWPIEPNCSKARVVYDRIEHFIKTGGAE